MSARYVAESAPGSGLLGVAWDVVDTKTNEFVGFIYRSTAEDVADDLNRGVIQRDVYHWSAR